MNAPASIAVETTQVLQTLGLGALANDGDIASHSPIDGRLLGRVASHDAAAVETSIARSQAAFEVWRSVPAPRRGELIRLFGEILREHKDALGALVTLECGKILQEGLGEVQEMIDICDFAVGLSRQLYGLTIASERPGHKMVELWQPLGPVGIISAFNFPVAVWSWNTALAIVCGNTTIWKPSERTPLTALACQHLFALACERFGDAPAHLSQVLLGDARVGETLVNDARLPIISATGSTAMGRKVGPAVAARFGRSILELGGNNAIIVAPSADLELAVPGIVFGAVGTAGQRCTSTRRLFVHDDQYDALLAALRHAYASVRVGDPLAAETLVGPLIGADSFAAMSAALDAARAAGGQVHGGDRVGQQEHGDDAFYVRPALVEMPAADRTVQEETFAPILYVYRYTDLADAIRMQNDVPQGLSSAIFTTDLREAELFTSACGSDCGIANVNIGTSGAEIGGAFGGEKETGGGRESGSDAWKGYMRRMTSTTNYSRELPLAQGIKFEL
ncbi:MAG: aldehyde dehydrogenase family protein [Pseudomonadota bacterium]